MAKKKRPKVYNTLADLEKEFGPSSVGRVLKSFREADEPIHVDLTGPDCEAKFWLEPIVVLAISHGLSKKQLTKLQDSVEKNYDQIVSA
jgi:hypothetical protein